MTVEHIKAELIGATTILSDAPAPSVVRCLAEASTSPVVDQLQFVGGLLAALWNDVNFCAVSAAATKDAAVIGEAQIYEVTVVPGQEPSQHIAKAFGSLATMAGRADVVTGVCDTMKTDLDKVFGHLDAVRDLLERYEARRAEAGPASIAMRTGQEAAIGALGQYIGQL